MFNESVALKRNVEQPILKHLKFRTPTSNFWWLAINKFRHLQNWNCYIDLTYYHFTN